jgi:outer membrane protein
MKNTNYIINGILGVAVIILFILYFTGKKSSDNPGTAMLPDSLSVQLPIAYIEVDSLLSNYNYFKDLNNLLLDKKEKSTAQVNSRASQLEKEYMDFQMKAQNNAFITTERRQQEGERLARKEQELQEFAAKVQQELATEQMKMTSQMTDTIISSLKIFNESKKYQLIFSKQGTNPFFIANEAYDITSEVIKFLNNRYVPSKDK